MKKVLTLFLTICLIFTGITTVYGAHGKKPSRPHKPLPKQHKYTNKHYPSRSSQRQAHQVLRRTAEYLIQAQHNSRKYHGNYHGLGRAIAHQNRARQLYFEGWYDRAIAHSIQARRIAIGIIRQNRGRIDEKSAFNDYDERNFRDYHHDDLEGEIYFNLVDDNKALHIHIDLD